MRRSEREIKDRAVVDDIIRQCLVCRLGLVDGVEPYVVPLCFGYDGEALYFHGASDGRKIDVLRKNNHVCFEFDIPEGMREAEQGCRWGIKYRSVIGFGTAEIVNDQEGKKKALEIIMAQYSGREYIFPEEIVTKTAVIKVVIARVTGKQA
ncbi:MAG: pyridoxamine 5'-phosphate oxidase family protein [Syntrophales bacterium]|jgi:nitroimidazol reductase NimA-like FMN-containing flavoprotein (pyridoxamine 5'-phosphate oxidase superfamily)